MADDTPGPDPQVTDEEILDVFQASHDPVLTASEVAEEVTIERRTVYDRLVKLEAQNRVKSKKVGGRTTVWWIP